MAAEKKIKHKLLIEFIFRINRRFSFEKSPLPVQNQPFKVGLKIKNIGTKSFPGCTVKNLVMSSGENKSLKHEFEEEHSISTLNPDQEADIWWPDPLSTFLEGLVWLTCLVIPNDPEREEIETYQRDKNTGTVGKSKHLNKWDDPLYIKGKFEFEQARTNLLIFILTLLTLLEGLFGIKEVVFWTLELLRGRLVWLLMIIDWLLG